MNHLLFGFRVASLLILGPIVVAGSLWLELKGGILGCPFPFPFIMCHFCPVYCTFGSIRTGLFYSLLGTNILLGRVFCGFFCPGGAAQDMFFKLPVKKISLPKALDTALKWLKYLLAFVIVLLVLEATEIWRGIPAISSLWFWLLKHSTQTGNALIALVALFLLAAIFLSRAWCRYLCPLGAWMSPFSKYSLTELTYDGSKCVQCYECSQRCPGGVRNAGEGWDSAECLRCLECYVRCKSRAFGFKIKGVGNNGGKSIAATD